MPATPRESAAPGDRATIEVTPEQWSVDVEYWADGTPAVKVELRTKAATYRFTFSRLQFLSFLVRGLEAFAEMLRELSKAR